MLRLSAQDGKRLSDRLIDPPAIPPAGLSAEPAPRLGETGLDETGIDDATAAYVAALREPFELLRQAEAQLAGLMVLATASGQAIAGHPMLDLAAEAIRQAEDGIRAARVPARARHHHAHLRQALREIRLAAENARRCLVRRDETAIDAALAPLRSAHQHLLWATAALPGFEIVALSEGCCAQHAAAAQQKKR